MGACEIGKRRLSFDADKGIKVPPDEDLDALNPIADAANLSSLSDGEMLKRAPSEEDALSCALLDASMSAVSHVTTTVAASRDRVNEVHVMQYLGMSMVCIAANFVQDARGRTSTPGASGDGKRGEIDAGELVSSAMFLAFVVNGQRYLAKVTEK